LLDPPLKKRDCASLLFKKDDIHNGERATLIDFNDKQVAIRLANGKQIDLPRNHFALQHMEHGYVLTTYKAQGKDKPYAIGLMESNQKFSANLQNFYVQISRAVHGMTLVTDDKEKLTQAIHKNTELKPASLDIIDSKRLQMHQENYKAQQNIDYVIQQKKSKEDFTKEL
jgi:ATP-dependent exoDNAse (exonuclease V) alpha subunit